MPRYVLILEYLDGQVYNMVPFHDGYKSLEEMRLINSIVAVDLNDSPGFILLLSLYQF